MFGLFSKTRQRCVGVDISSHAIKIVELSRKRGVFELQAYAIESLPTVLVDDQTSTEPKSVIAVLCRALAKAGGVARDAVVALPDTQVICKVLELEAGLNESDLELHVRLEAEQYVPYALEEMALDYAVLGHSPVCPERVSVLLVTCRKETLEWYQQVLAGAGLKAQVVEIQAHGLVLGTDWMLRSITADQAGGAVAVVDFAPDTTRLSIVQEDQVVYTRELLFERGSLGEEAFRACAVEHLRRGLELFAESGAQEKVGLIVLSGVAASSAGLSQWVEVQLGTPTHLANPFVGMNVNPALAPEALFCDAPLLLAACGLAMRGFD